MMGSMSVDEGEVAMAASMMEMARSSSFTYRAATEEALAACETPANKEKSTQLRRDERRKRKAEATHDQSISVTFSLLSYAAKRKLCTLVISLGDERESLSHCLLRFRRRGVIEDSFEDESGRRKISNSEEESLDGGKNVDRSVWRGREW